MFRLLIGWFDGVSFPKNREPQSTLDSYRHSEGHSVVLAHHPSWKRYQPFVWHPVVKRFLDWR